MNTTDRDSCTHHFEHVKEPHPENGREYIQCTKCGLHNALGLFQTVDFERDGTVVKADLNRREGIGYQVNKGRSTGPHLQWVKNTTGRPEYVYTREEWDNANPPLKEEPMSDPHNAISNWTVFMAMAVLFYVSAWHTKNPEYVTVANTALTMAAVLFVTDFIILIRRNR